MDGTDEENLDHVLGVENQHEAVALARALCPFAEAATDEQMLICVALVEAKGDEKRVSDALGLPRGRLRRHYLSHLSERIIKHLAKNRLQGVGYLKAVCALESVTESQSQTGTARRQAAEAIIKLGDDATASRGDSASDGMDLNNMTLVQLQAFVDTIKQNLRKLPPKNDVQTIEHQP